MLKNAHNFPQSEHSFSTKSPLVLEPDPFKILETIQRFHPQFRAEPL